MMKGFNQPAAQEQSDCRSNYIPEPAELYVQSVLLTGGTRLGAGSYIEIH